MEGLLRLVFLMVTSTPWIPVYRISEFHGALHFVGTTVAPPVVTNLPIGDSQDGHELRRASQNPFSVLSVPGDLRRAWHALSSPVFICRHRNALPLVSAAVDPVSHGHTAI